MATLNYKLHEQEERFGENKGKKVFRAYPVIHGKVSFDEFCKELSDGSTVDEADVKAVLSRLTTVITRNLKRGFSVDCGELGTFRPAFGSKGALTKEEFSTSLITPPRVVYTPRVAFKTSLRSVGFERFGEKSGGAATGKNPSAGSTEGRGTNEPESSL